MIDPINVYSVKGLNEKILYFLCVLITEVSTVFQFLYFLSSNVPHKIYVENSTLFANKEKEQMGL